MAVEVRRSRGWSGAVVLALAAMAAVLAPQVAFAKTYTVTRTNDPAPGACQANNCSLREAVLAANAHAGSDKVVLPNHRHAYELTIPGTGEDGAMDGDLDVTNNPLRVVHPGKGRATVRGNGIDERIFDVFTGAPTTFDRLVVTGGNNPSPMFEGGGIRSDADVVVLSSRIVGNTSVEHGGGIGLQSGAGLRLIRSTVANNHTTSGDGGGIDGDTGAVVIKRSRIVGNGPSGNGGAMYFFSSEPSLISKSTIAGNQAPGQGGAIYQAQGPTDPALRIVGSTLSGNHADAGGGAIFISNGRLSLTNSTFAGNRTTDLGGAIWNAGGQVTANAITVARNVAGPAGGGLFYGSGAPGFDVRNSLIALNRLGDGTRNDCAGDEAFDSFGHNLLSTLGPTGACQGFDQPGDLVRSQPRIGPLANNGGPTKTVALKKHSPAIGKASRHTAPGRDQRGKKRDRRPDIGAFERLP
jgi:CSLREA domain-containing protein